MTDQKFPAAKVMLIVLLVIVIAAFGGYCLYKRHHSPKSKTTVTTSDWATIVQPWNCPLDSSGIPPTLQQESTGSCVKFLQFALNLGANGGKPVISSPIEQDGVFGDKTKTYVLSLQQKTGLKADGIVESSTWQKIKSCMNTGKNPWVCPTL